MLSMYRIVFVSLVSGANIHQGGRDNATTPDTAHRLVHRKTCKIRSS